MAQPADFAYTMGTMAGDHRHAGRWACGNFKGKFFKITNVDDYPSIVPNVTPVLFACSTNTSDNDDLFGTGPMNVEGTADGNDPNTLSDSSETFSSMWNGLMAINEDDKTFCQVSCEDATQLLCFIKGVANDTFPGGNEAWNVTSDRHVEMTAVNTDEDGYLIVFGR